MDELSVAAQLARITNIIGAAGALGTAAFGLVDASKALGGGVSNAGFKDVRQAVGPFLAADGVSKAFGKADILATLRANWLNGVPKAEQKAKAKSLVRLGLTPAGAPKLAAAAGIAEAELKECAERIHAGIDLTPQDLNILGRFDAILSAVLDEGYERGDQRYRTVSKLAAGVVAIVLAVIGGGLIYSSGVPTPSAAYFGSNEMWKAFLIGAVSTPLAPIAKDLASSLTAAVKAASVVKR